MSTLRETDLQVVRLHLRHAWDHMQRFMETSGDWRGQMEVREEFRSLLHTVKEFALNHGIECPHR